MGKLADLKSKRNEMEWDHPDRIEIEKQINDIEQWCIDNGNKYIKKLTVWHRPQRGNLSHTQNHGDSLVLQNIKQPQVQWICSTKTEYDKSEWKFIKIREHS